MRESRPHRNPRLRRRLASPLELGTLTWPNSFDLDSIALHDEIKQAGLLHRTAA
jgi:hypothetical protein